MTIEQQLRDRFDRETGALPTADLATAIAGGRRRRRRRRLVQGATGVAAVAVAGAVVVPQLGGDDTLQRDRSTAASGPAAESLAAESLAAGQRSFVPGTEVDEKLQGALAAAVAALPPARDVYPSDWSRDTPLPDAEFANATDWQLAYDLSATDELRVLVGKPLPGSDEPLSCAVAGPDCTEPEVADLPVGASLTTTRQTVGEGRDLTYWFLAEFRDADGRYVNVAEQVAADSWEQAAQRRVLADDQLVAAAVARGLDFPDPIDAPPAP